MSRLSASALSISGTAAPLTTESPGSTGRFHRLVRIALPTGGQAHGILISPDTVLEVTFSAREYDALEATGLAAATLTTGSNGLVLRFPVARLVRSVTLSQTEPGDQVVAYRFDGPVVSDDPVATGTHAAAGAPLNVVDAQMILRRRRAGTDLALTPGDIAAVTVSVEPGQSRVAFIIQGDPEGEIVLPPSTDDGGVPVVSKIDSWGPRLAAALTSQIARFASAHPTLPDPLEIDLILEADAPCLAAVTDLDIGYELTRNGFSDGTSKQVLRFAAGRGETRSILLDLPNCTSMVSGLLRLTLAGGSSPAVQRQGASGPGADVMTPVTQGVALQAGRLAAARIDVVTPLVVTGLDAVIGTIETPADVVASLWEDSQGLPGRRLAESRPMAVTSGRPVTVPMTFDPGVPQPAGPLWAALTVHRGRVVLGLIEDGNGVVATGDGTDWALVASAEGQTAALRVRTPPLPGMDGVAAGGGILVTVGSDTVSLTPDGRAHVADLAAILNGMKVPRPTQIAITVQADGGGVVTVDPPVLRYVVT